MLIFFAASLEEMIAREVVWRLEKNAADNVADGLSEEFSNLHNLFTNCATEFNKPFFQGGP